MLEKNQLTSVHIKNKYSSEIPRKAHLDLFAVQSDECLDDVRILCFDGHYAGTCI